MNYAFFAEGTSIIQFKDGIYFSQNALFFDSGLRLSTKLRGKVIIAFLRKKVRRRAEGKGGKEYGKCLEFTKLGARYKG